MNVRQLRSNYYWLSSPGKEVETALVHAITREWYTPTPAAPGLNMPVHIHPSIRESYFDLFTRVINRRTLVQGIAENLGKGDLAKRALQMSEVIPFRALTRGHSGIAILQYGPEEINLQISDHRFEGDKEIRDIGSFTTSLDENGNPQT